MTGLLDGFLDSLSRYGERPAVLEAERRISYRDLALLARRIARVLPSPSGAPSLGAVYVPRGARAYAAILGVLWSGRGYVPINPRFPLSRNAALLAAVQPDVIIVDASLEPSLPAFLTELTTPATVVILDGQAETRRAFAPHHTVVCDLAADTPAASEPCRPLSEIAYLLFTSGSTGAPKGIAVTHASVCRYLTSIRARYALGCEDRVSQVFDLTFDLSVHDMFACWFAGACLYPLPETALMQAPLFIRRHELTAWFSVPSLAAALDRLHLLPDQALPSLRLSLFCGEPLPERTAGAWRRAAPASRIDNLFGPTEATIACTAFEFGRDEAVLGARGGLVPIGWPLPEQRVDVTAANGAPVSSGTIGELWLAGSQTARGYWRNPVQTNERFLIRPELDGDGDLWFRTGDLVQQGPDGCLHFMGRQDDQIKIRGHRVELLEVDHALRHASRTPDALAIAWPTQEAAEEVLGVVPGTSVLSASDILASCRAMLPPYMVPRRVVFVGDMPRNANGKLDRKGLARLIADRDQGLTYA